MSDRTIVYLHGFNSSPGSVKGRVLAEAIGRLADPPRYHRPQLAHRPAQAIEAVTQWVERNVDAIGGLTFIGSSLGGYYATWLAERYAARAVVINPAVRPERSLASFAGPQVNPYTGERYELTPKHFDELSALRVAKLTQPSRYLLMVRSGDELLDWRDAVACYAGGFQYVLGGGDHGWEDFAPQADAILQFAGCV